jgi:Flp pilus assembly protein TadB
MLFTSTPEHCEEQIMSKRLGDAPVSARAGDGDRQKTAARLGQALAQGYLRMDEYEERVQAVFQTLTNRELQQLVADLPLDRIRRADPRRRAARLAAARRGVRVHLAAYFAMVAIVLTVWTAVAVTAGAWYFWPIWPMLGGAIGLVSHAMSVPGSRASHLKMLGT